MSADFKRFRRANKLTQADIAAFLGCTQGFISQVEKGVSTLSPEFISIILANPDWDTSMFTGDGGMLKEGAGDSSGRGSRIRYWVDVDATAGGVELFDDMTTNRFIDLSIPEFRDCTDAVNLYGDSMMPLYRNGQIIILKEWKENFIDFGNVYLVITCNGNRMVKYLRRGSDADHVLCISENKDFDPFEIERKDILRLYLVKGGISKNTL
jgi:transcriptional regulator with XRE-family HTH domain